MKKIIQYINEKLKVGQKRTYKYCPKDGQELKQIVTDLYDDETGMCDLRDVDVSNLTQFCSAFSEIKWKVKTIDVTGWDVSNVVYFYSLFSYCAFLEEIIGLDTWEINAAKVDPYYRKSMFEIMFKGCKKLKRLDLSSWNINSDHIGMKEMFMGCSELEEIKGIDAWKNIVEPDQKLFYLSCMFDKCPKLHADISKWKYKPRNTKTSPHIKTK